MHIPINGQGPSINYEPSLKRPRVSTIDLNTERGPYVPSAAVVPPPSDAVVPPPFGASVEETDSLSSGSLLGSLFFSDSESDLGHNLTGDGSGVFGESEGRSRRGPVSATLTDLDVLDCPICLEPLCSPVYQCENGHISCVSCCIRMAKKCSNCCRPIGTIRCRILEKVLESVYVPCPNLAYGCMETLNYSSKKHDHEKTCKCAPCSCPYAGCKYLDMSIGLYKHFARVHSQSSKQFVFESPVSISLDNRQVYVFLQEKNQNTIFIVNRTITSLGNLVKVICVGPVPAKGSSFSYDLRAKIDRDTSIKIKTSVECMTKWTAEACLKRCLVIPVDLIDINGRLKLELTVRKNPAFAG